MCGAGFVTSAFEEKNSLIGGDFVGCRSRRIRLLSEMLIEQIPGVVELSPEEKYILANELWEAIEGNEGLVPIDKKFEKLLEKRHREYLENPDEVISWGDLKEKLRKR